MNDISKAYNIIMLTSAMGLAATAQLLVKYAINTVMAKRAVQSSNTIINLFNCALNVHFISGVILYLVATFLWMYSLTKVELSYATPFLALTYVIMMFGAFYFFNETFTVHKILGSILVIAGLVIINIGN